MFKIKTLFSFFILFPLIVFGQFKKSDIRLSSDFVESILIDQRGIKWIGTDEGLNLITHSNIYPFYSNISNKKGILNSEVHKIKEVNDEDVIIDINHALAGKTLTFDIEIIDIK